MLLVGLWMACAAAASSRGKEPIASARSGSWLEPGNWQGGVVPGDGDNVVLSNGHTITIPPDTTVIVGSSPSDDQSTPALQPESRNGTGALVVDGTLVLRGSVKQGNALWRVNAGGVIEHDSSHAAESVSYSWQIGLADHQDEARLVLAGSGPGADRVRVRNAVGSSRFGGFHDGTSFRDLGQSPWNYDGFIGGGRVEATFTTFTELGSAAVEWLTATLGSAAHRIILDNCIVEGSSSLVVLGIAGPSTIRLRATSILDTVNDRAALLQFTDVLTAPGERLIEGSVLEGTLVAAAHRDLTLRRTILAGSTTGSPPFRNSGTRGYFAEVTDLLVYNRNSAASSDTSQLVGPVRRLVSLRADTESTLDGDHFRGGPPGFPDSASIDIDGVVAEYQGTSTGGEIFIFQPGSSSSPYPISIRNVLALPNGAGSASRSDSLAAIVGGVADAIEILVENNTACGASAMLFAELTSTSPGVVTSVSNNLNWNTGGNGRMVRGAATTWAEGTIVRADVNLHFGTAEDPYSVDPAAFETFPGANDLSIDPQFVDDTRDFLSWGQTLDPAHQHWTDIYHQLRKLNDDTGYDSRYDWRAFYRWARAGFRPTNPLLSKVEGAIGAIPMNTIFSDGFESGDTSYWNSISE